MAFDGWQYGVVVESYFTLLPSQDKYLRSDKSTSLTHRGTFVVRCIPSLGNYVANLVEIIWFFQTVSETKTRLPDLFLQDKMQNETICGQAEGVSL